MHSKSGSHVFVCLSIDILIDFIYVLRRNPSSPVYGVNNTVASL